MPLMHVRSAIQPIARIAIPLFSRRMEPFHRSSGTLLSKLKTAAPFSHCTTVQRIDATATPSRRPHLVILGSGYSSIALAKALQRDKIRVTIVRWSTVGGGFSSPIPIIPIYRHQSNVSLFSRMGAFVMIFIDV